MNQRSAPPQAYQVYWTDNPRHECHSATANLTHGKQARACQCPLQSRVKDPDELIARPLSPGGSDAGASLQSLRGEDKRRVATLVQQLSKAKRDRARLKSQLEAERAARAASEARASQLLDEQLSLRSERDSLHEQLDSVRTAADAARERGESVTTLEQKMRVYEEKIVEFEKRLDEQRSPAPVNIVHQVSCPATTATTTTTPSPAVAATATVTQQRQPSSEPLASPASYPQRVSVTRAHRTHTDSPTRTTPARTPPPSSVTSRRTVSPALRSARDLVEQIQHLLDEHERERDRSFRQSHDDSLLHRNLASYPDSPSLPSFSSHHHTSQRGYASFHASSLLGPLGRVRHNDSDDDDALSIASELNRR